MALIQVDVAGKVRYVYQGYTVEPFRECSYILLYSVVNVCGQDGCSYNVIRVIESNSSQKVSVTEKEIMVG